MLPVFFPPFPIVITLLGKNRRDMVPLLCHGNFERRMENCLNMEYLLQGLKCVILLAIATWTFANQVEICLLKFGIIPFYCGKMPKMSIYFRPTTSIILIILKQFNTMADVLCILYVPKENTHFWHFSTVKWNYAKQVWHISTWFGKSPCSYCKQNHTL